MKLGIWVVPGIITAICAIIFYYPTVFYIFLFVVYSAILVLISCAGTIYVHFLLSSKNQAQANLPSNVLYNATW